MSSISYGRNNKLSLTNGMFLNTTSPGQSRGRAGASLLTADRLSRRVDLLTRLNTCHWAPRHDRTMSIFILFNIAHDAQLSTRFPFD